jgi:hypothetical protein
MYELYMNPVSIIEINTEYLYLVIVGEIQLIDEIVNNLKQSIKNKINEPKKENEYDIKGINCIDTEKITYMSVQINQPISNILSKIDNKKKLIVFDDGIENAHCYTYAEGYNDKYHILIKITEYSDKYIIGFPKFELSNNNDYNTHIDEWFKKNISDTIKKTPKLVTFVGSNSNIIVVATKIKRKK